MYGTDCVYADGDMMERQKYKTLMFRYELVIDAW